MLRAFRSYFAGVDSYPVYEGVPREELWVEPKPLWTSEAKDTSKPMLSTESLSESLASWFGVVLPKRVSVVQDLDDTTIFALEVFKVIPPSWIAILTVLGVVFLLYLGVVILKFVVTHALRRLKPRSRRQSPIHSTPHSARGNAPQLSAEVAAVLATLAANNSSVVASRAENSLAVQRERRRRN